VLDLKLISRKAVDLAFAVASQLLRPVVFKKITGYVYNIATGATATTVSTAVCNALVVHYQSRDVDGASIVYGDQKWLVKGSELEGISPLPSSGDWFEEFGIRYDIVNALQDATQQLWTFQVRRQFFDPTTTVENSEDWGSIATVASSFEAFGDLSLYTSRTDWT
jgi:hypothetical protein